MSNYVLDADELRRHFLRSAELPERIARYRQERVERVIRGDTPAALQRGGPTVVLHIVPLRSFDIGFSVDVREVGRNFTHFSPMAAEGWGGRYNLDGYLIRAAARAMTHKQLVRALRRAGKQHGDGTVMKALAELTRARELVNPKDKKGYRLAS